jgi:hypothetical protein
MLNLYILLLYATYNLYNNVGLQLLVCVCQFLYEVIDIAVPLVSLCSTCQREKV